MTVAEGAVAEQELTATDPEGSPITFVLVSGPFYVRFDRRPWVRNGIEAGPAHTRSP